MTEITTKRAEHTDDGPLYVLSEIDRGSVHGDPIDYRVLVRVGEGPIGRIYHGPDAERLIRDLRAARLSPLCSNAHDELVELLIRIVDCVVRHAEYIGGPASTNLTPLIVEARVALAAAAREEGQHHETADGHLR